MGERQKEVRQKGGTYTDFLLEREDLGKSPLLCPGTMYRQGNLNALFLVMTY